MNFGIINIIFLDLSTHVFQDLSIQFICYFRSFYVRVWVSFFLFSFSWYWSLFWVKFYHHFLIINRTIFFFRWRITGIFFPFLFSFLIRLCKTFLSILLLYIIILDSRMAWILPFLFVYLFLNFFLFKLFYIYLILISPYIFDKLYKKFLVISLI